MRAPRRIAVPRDATLGRRAAAGAAPRLARGAAVTLLWVGAAASVGATCALPADMARVAGTDAVELGWRAVPAPIRVGAPFEVEVALCPPSARLVRVDATMPAHRHGMNYRPSLRDTAPGRWRAQGLLWHMPGRWELRFDVEAGGTAQALRVPVDLP